MVVSVFHLTHQIEITSGVGHGAPILLAARRLALPPAGRPAPTVSSRSNTSASPEGYDVTGLFHGYISNVPTTQPMVTFLNGLTRCGLTEVIAKMAVNPREGHGYLSPKCNADRGKPRQKRPKPGIKKEKADCTELPQLAESVRLATPLARFGKIGRTATNQKVGSSSPPGRTTFFI